MSEDIEIFDLEDAEQLAELEESTAAEMVADSDDIDDYGFEDEDFETDDHHGHKVRSGRRRSISHIVVLLIVVLLVGFSAYKVVKWNKGTASDYNPDEDTSEFDVEPNDYIQPLSADQLAGKEDDGVTTILTLGNSPFADNYDDNNLAKAIGDAYGATVINGGFAEGYITSTGENYSDDMPEDGVSLYQVSKAIASGDFSVVEKAASTMSGESQRAAEALKNTDMSKVDMIVIMYNLEDYKDHRPLGSEDKDDVTCIYGSIYKSIAAIQEAYPYIRIVYLSQPAGGVTIDDFFVDGDIHDIGCGTLTEYINFEVAAVASRGASFIDVYYGAINVDQRAEYLVDDYHISDAGAKSVADRLKKLISYE